MPGPDVWADILDSLLLHIISLLSSFHDLLAFVGTCRSWRAALSSFPPAFSFNFPPLHLQLDDYAPLPPYNHFLRSVISNIKWQLVDPAKQASSLHGSAPQNIQDRMKHLGCSYGYLILSDLKQCLLLDVYSGATVKPPKFKSTGTHSIYCGFLVAPINSSNSYLLLCSKSSMFLWKVGSNSWSEHPLDVENILQIVPFKGEIIAMDLVGRFHRIRLVPQLSVQQVAVMWEEDMVVGLHYNQWLVVCGDKLLLVHFPVTMEPNSGFRGIFKVFCLDFSVEPAKWIKVDSLGNNALFVSNDTRNPTFSCSSPERWGGKSNSIYFANPSADCNEPWIVAELGQVVPVTKLKLMHIQLPTPGLFHHQQSLWVLPVFSMAVVRDQSLFALI